MGAKSKMVNSGFVVATPQRSVCDDNSRVLERRGWLRFIALGTRRGTQGIAPERTLLNPAIGLAAYIGAHSLPPFLAESFRSRLLPWFDRWVLKHLQPGDHMISSYAYANQCFRYVREHGGRTFLDAGNSHIENFWEILSEEHRRWKCPTPPIAQHWYERARRMLVDVDYVLSPSSYVTRTFLERGFKPEQILKNVYPLDLTCFKPPAECRPQNRELRVINTGSLSLRKGTPYLLEAFRMVLKQEPSARLLLTRIVQDDIKPVLEKYLDLPIEWAPGLPHDQLAARLQSADVFVLPSIEDGFARTVAEALACGLPVVLTPNTGARDLIEPGINGEVVPIRDSAATAEAILKCWERKRKGDNPPMTKLKETLCFKAFEKEFLDQLDARGFGEAPVNGRAGTKNIEFAH